MTVRIVTDSACDLTDEEASSLGIDIVPLSIRFGDQQFLDREELSVDDFYRRMAASDDLPQTAAPAGGVRGGVPPPHRRGCRRRRVHQLVERCLGDHAVRRDRCTGDHR